MSFALTARRLDAIQMAGPLFLITVHVRSHSTAADDDDDDEQLSPSLR